MISRELLKNNALVFLLSVLVLTNIVYADNPPIIPERYWGYVYVDDELADPT